MDSNITRSLRGRVAAGAAVLLIATGVLVGPLGRSAHADAADAGGAARQAAAADRRGCDEERNTQHVLAALRVVFSEHRVDQIDQFFAEDFVQHSPYALPGGREELKQWWAHIVYAIPDVTTTVSQTVTKCGEVVTFRTVQGTIVHDLPELGITGKGQQISFPIADIFRVADGKITAHWEVVDTGPFTKLALTN